MGAHILAIAVWLGSLAIYGAAFFWPEVHRRHDFFWSGVGAFYGLVLWFTAAQTSPTELLGHGASVVLLGWLGTQTLTLRRKRTPIDLQTPVGQDAWSILGQRVKQSLMEVLQGTPLGRWLPEAPRGLNRRGSAEAPSTLRASSLKDIDYEFVDELTPSPRRSPPVMVGIDAPAPDFEPVSPPSSAAVRSRRPPRQLPSPAASLSPSTQVLQRQKPTTLWGRLAGLRGWVGDVVKTRAAAKPKRAVIDIPPRPSPLAKTNPTARVEDPTNPGQIPTVTIVDTEAIESLAAPDLADGDGATAPGEQVVGVGESPPLTSEEVKPREPAGGLAGNEDNDDENWPEAPGVIAPSPNQPD